MLRDPLRQRIRSHKHRTQSERLREQLKMYADYLGILLNADSDSVGLWKGLTEALYF